jgi:protein-S-isoprenylcysteine O-methyltransferase Ste14
MPAKKILPPTYHLLAIGLMVLLHILFPIAQLLSGYLPLIALILVGIGMVINSLASKAFKAHQTTVKPFAESTALVMTGSFRFSRNPMYLGFMLALMAIALLLGSLSPGLWLSYSHLCCIPSSSA